MALDILYLLLLCLAFYFSLWTKELKKRRLMMEKRKRESFLSVQLCRFEKEVTGQKQI